MADKSIKITIDSALNASGFRKAEVELHKLGKNFKGSISSLKTIAAGIFAIPGAFKQGKEWGDAIFKNIIAPFMKSKGLINDVSDSSEKFIDTISKASADGIAKIADEYKSITDSAKASADARQRELRYMQEQIKLLHDAKDAELELAKQRKLASLAPDDSYGRSKVEQEYNTIAGINGAMRSQESAVLQRQALEKEAEDAKKAAEKIDGIVDKLQKRLVSARTRAGTLEKFSTMRNEKDRSWKNLFGISRTSEGDALREEQKKGAETARKEADKIDADIKAKQAEAEKLRVVADDALRRRAALWKQIETSEVKIEAERVKNTDVVAKIEADNAKELEDIKKKASNKAIKAELTERRDAMKKLHDERMKQLDAEQAKVQKQIDAAKAKGFDNLMATAGGGYYGNGTLDQGNEERERRQRIIGAQRAVDAEQKLRDRMEKTGASLDDPTKLGRMSNLERAAFERLKLKDQEKQAAKLQQEKDNREKQMAKDLDDINKKLQEVGL